MTPSDHTITEVELLRRPRGYCAVYVDGSVALKAHQRTVAGLGLWAGKQLTSEELGRAIATAQEEEALRQALDSLAACGKTEEELRRRLARREFPQPTIATVLERLRAKGLIDDHQYAREYVKTQSARRGLGPAALRARLAELGVSSSTSDEALAEEMSEETQRVTAEQAARKRLKSLRAAGPQEARSRMYGFLLRRGFDDDVADEVTETLLADE